MTNLITNKHSKNGNLKWDAKGVSIVHSSHFCIEFTYTLSTNNMKEDMCCYYIIDSKRKKKTLLKT